MEINSRFTGKESLTTSIWPGAWVEPSLDRKKAAYVAWRLFVLLKGPLVADSCI